MPKAWKQSDPMIADKMVGYGSGKYQTFRYVGCVVCSLTYLYNLVRGTELTPLEVNQRLKDAGAFLGASVLWKKNGVDLINKALPGIKFYYRDWNYNNAIVSSWIYIYPKMPTLAQVVEPSSKTGSHFVLLLGGRKLYNSITGQVQATSIYKTWIGSVRFQKA